jgi:hypothetical protein
VEEGKGVKRGRGLLAVALAVAWVFLVVILYYVRHKPFTAAGMPEPAAAGPGPSGAAAAGLAGAVLLVCAATGLGLTVSRRLGLAPAEGLVWAAALGLGALSLAGLGLGAAGLLRPAVLWILTLLFLAATGRSLWRAVRAAWRDPAWRPRGGLELCLAAFCALTLGMALVHSLLPPTSWDAMVYHLTGPRLYLESGAVTHPIDLPYLGFPQLVETLFTWAMGLVGERAAAPMHLAFGALAVFGLLTAGRRHLNGTAAWLAAALLLSADTIAIIAGWAYVDLATLVYSTLAFLAMARAAAGPAIDRRWLLVSGAMAGFAVSTKYTALATIPALAAALVSAGLTQRRAGWGWQATLRAVLLLTLVAIAVWSPWLAKNLVLTGNPTYPFFFEGIHWDEWRAWWYDRPGTGLAGEPLKLLTAAWDSTIWGVEGGAGYSATIGPLFLALAPLLALSWRQLSEGRRSWLRMALVFFGAQYAFWLWGLARSALLQQTRLLLPAFGVLALMAAAAVAGLRSVRRFPVDLAWLVRAVVAGVLTLTLVSSLYSFAVGRPLSVLFGTAGTDHYLTWRLGWHRLAMEAVNSETQQGDIVLFLWEPRSYYCERSCWPDALLDRWLHATHVHGQDASAIAGEWRSAGVTHVLLCQAGYRYVVDGGFDPITPQDQETLGQLVDTHLELVQDLGGEYALYLLR